MQDFTKRMTLRMEQIDPVIARNTFIKTAREFRQAQMKYDLYTFYNSDGKIPEEVTNRYLDALEAFDQSIIDIRSHHE